MHVVGSMLSFQGTQIVEKILRNEMEHAHRLAQIDSVNFIDYNLMCAGDVAVVHGPDYGPLDVDTSHRP